MTRMTYCCPTNLTVRCARVLFVLAASASLILVTTGFQKGGGSTPPPNPEISFADAGLKVMNADGTNVRTVVRAGSNDAVFGSCWSPNGTKLAFVRAISGAYGLWTVNLDGTGATLIHAYNNGPYIYGSGTPDWSPTASPDGQSKIVFAKFRPDWAVTATDFTDIYIVNPNGTGLVNLTGTLTVSESDPVWGLDGSTLYFKRGHDLVRVSLGIDGLGNVQTTSEEVVATLFDYMFSPNHANRSTTLCFDTQMPGETYHRIYAADLTETTFTPRLVTRATSGAETNASFSPDDSKVVFWRSAGNQTGIYTVNRDGTAEIRVSSRGRYPKWKRAVPGGPQ